MKLTIEFNLPEESTEFKHMMKHNDYSFVIYDFAQHLRNVLKYKGITDEEDRIYSEVSDTFWAICNDYNVDPYED